MSLLSVENISKNYHSLKGETTAIKDISFNLNNGELLSIIGPSGCGKSTLLNILSGILKPSNGKITFLNEKLDKNLNKIGYMFQKDHLFEWNTVWDNVTLGLKIKKILTKEKIEFVENLLKEYNLSQFKNHYPKELSGGMRQRVALIRTLALSPELLFLDEPFSALDYQSRLKACDDVFHILKRENKTAIMVTHDIAEAISMSDRVIVLTKRPATIKNSLTITFKNNNLSPFKKRNEPEFKDYFDFLWKELDN